MKAFVVWLSAENKTQTPGHTSCKAAIQGNLCSHCEPNMTRVKKQITPLHYKVPSCPCRMNGSCMLRWLNKIEFWKLNIPEFIWACQRLTGASLRLWRHSMYVSWALLCFLSSPPLPACFHTSNSRHVSRERTKWQAQLSSNWPARRWHGR